MHTYLAAWNFLQTWIKQTTNSSCINKEMCVQHIMYIKIRAFFVKDTIHWLSVRVMFSRMCLRPLLGIWHCGMQLLNKQKTFKILD